MNRGEFTRAVLAKIGGQINGKTITFGVAWAAFEGTSALNNPWATTEPWARSTQFNSVGVRNYDSWQDGIDATVATLLNGYYDHLVKVLKDPNATPRQMLGALTSSPWGSHPTSQLFMDVEQNFNHFNEGVPGSPVEVAKPVVAKPIHIAPVETPVTKWADWISTQLESGGFALAMCKEAVWQYLNGKTVTNPELAQNLWSMIFSTGKVDARYVPPVTPVPQVLGANPALFEQLSTAISGGDIATADRIESFLGLPLTTGETMDNESTETAAEIANEPANDVDTLEARQAAANAASVAAVAAAATAVVTDTTAPLA